MAYPRQPTVDWMVTQHPVTSPSVMFALLTWSLDIAVWPKNKATWLMMPYVIPLPRQVISNTSPCSVTFTSWIFLVCLLLSLFIDFSSRHHHLSPGLLQSPFECLLVNIPDPSVCLPNYSWDNLLKTNLVTMENAMEVPQKIKCRISL